MSSPSAASRRPQTFLEGVKSSLAKVFFRVLMGSQRFLMAAAAVLGPICVLLALGLITTVTYHYFVSIMPYYLESGWLSFEGLFHATIAVWIVFNLVFNYVMAIYTPPGSPSVATQKPMSAAEAERAPYCRKCEKPKPARSHHCSICKKCILRMDHHCPWVANCVGHNNHRYFVLFLVYMTAGTFYVTLVALIPFKILFVDEEEYPVPMVDPVTVKFSFVLCLSIMVSVGSMMIWHLYLVATQQTTIEFYDNLSDSREYRRRKMVWRNPYDEGLKQNFDAIFGRNSLWWRWLLPSTRPLLSEEGNACGWCGGVPADHP